MLSGLCIEGFEVPEPSVQVSPRQPPLDEDEEENSNECEDGFHSISSYFDKFEIGQQAILKDSVRHKPDLVFFLTIMAFRQALLMMPRRYQIFPAQLLGKNCSRQVSRALAHP